MRARDPDTEAWIERARRADLWQVLDRISGNHAVKRRGRRGVGPCPACGGKDRFSIDTGKGMFFCRGTARTGGDVIALVQHITGASFLGACEEITGEAMPRRAPGDDVRRADPHLMEQRKRDAEAEADRRAREANAYREREMDRARSIWAEGVPLSGTTAEKYLRGRGVSAPPGARLRFHPGLNYWHHVDGGWRVISKAPALLARIDDGAHGFSGCHCTWLDLSTRKGKAEIVDPETGEILVAKKVRGSQKGGHIHLGGDPATATHLICGEGSETTLAVREALLIERRDLSATLFWAAVNLGNIGGRAAGTVPHPVLRRTDTRGRIRRVFVPGPVPAEEDDGDPVLLPPDGISHATLLQDGDSDPFTTLCTLQRGAARWQAARPSRSVAIASPGEGVDFGDLMMAEGAA